MDIWHNVRNNCEEYLKGFADCNSQKKGCSVARGKNRFFHAG